ncbi:hypothetical protein Acr_27g0000540 [Actinidia rufa]|uniref:Uncharacterized protein n=1 Tax=Actinidia rufa TaxID=165716 RepID=A0A7J0H5T8_9ERIC|nr:hypothetical protein Acr_27g0000540 [Actinidia rufa]
MASVSMAMSLTHKGLRNQPTSGDFLKQLPLRPSNKPVFVSSRSRAIRVVQVQASLKEKSNHRANSSCTDSFHVVLTAILGAVIGVANFDPVKRT